MPRQYTPRVPSVCKSCGKTMLVVPCRILTQQYCSRACADIARAARTKKIICATCGREFTVPGSRVDTARYCSRACRYVPAKSLEKYFWGNVQKTSTCWLWRGGPWYGEACYAGKRYSAHRLSYEFAYGPIPDGLVVCHACDTPACVRPDHLFLGTSADNSHDMAAKGRSAWGERNANVRLCVADIIEIRRASAAGVSNAELGRRYGVTAAAIYLIVYRKNWQHVA